MDDPAEYPITNVDARRFRLRSIRATVPLKGQLEERRTTPAIDDHGRRGRVRYAVMNDERGRPLARFEETQPSSRIHDIRLFDTALRTARYAAQLENAAWRSTKRRGYSDLRWPLTVRQRKRFIDAVDAWEIVEDGFLEAGARYEAQNAAVHVRHLTFTVRHAYRPRYA